jgi:hypothetical protein
MQKIRLGRRYRVKAGRRLPANRTRRVFECLEPRWTLSVSVLTYHNDLASTGLNAAEAVLTPATVNTASFQKFFATSLDGQVYAQPLVDPGVTIAAGTNTTAGLAGLHDIVLAATEHDSLYAIDASPMGMGAVLWQRSFLNIAAGYVGMAPGSNINNPLGATSITTLSSADVSADDISPEIGITSTPVIDPATNTVYVVVRSKETIDGTAHYIQRLHAINIADGTDRAIPFLIGDTTGGNTNNTPIYVYGDGDGAVVDPYNNTGNQVVQFNALRENQRSAVTLENNVVYVAWASLGDISPYHGWVVGWNVSNVADSGMTLAGVFNASPNGGFTGIWESGGGPVFEPDGSAFYVVTGNGPPTHAAPVLDGSGFPVDGSYYDAVVKVVADPTTTPTSQNINGWGFKVADYFIPYNQVALDSRDMDLGSGGPLLLPNSAGIPGHPHLLVAGGKEGKLYLIDRDNMGKFDATNDNVINAVPNGSGHNTPPVLVPSMVFSTPAYYNHTIYIAGAFGDTAKAFAIGSNGTLTATSQTTATFGDEEGSLSISSNGGTAGVVWVMDRGANEIHAYNANNLGVELWNSGLRAGGADSLGSVVKFASPTVANGEVFVGTSNSLVVYGATSLLNSVTISNVAVVEATPQNGVLEADERLKITWAAAPASRIMSATLTIDGRAVSPVNGPYGPVNGNVFFSSVFGPLAAGTHSYIIQVRNSTGVVGTTSGTFMVAAAPPLISSVAVAEATRQDGILQANEKGVISWALTDGNPITSKSLTIDGAAIAIRGPFGPVSGNLFYSAGFGPLVAGSHSYTIQMTDSAGQSNSVNGTFTVAPIPIPSISLVAVAEATRQNGVLESDEPLKITWQATSSNGVASQTMTVDGRTITPINGPYGGSFYSCPIGKWSAGDHAFVITATDAKGGVFSDSGTFTVAASAATPPSISSVAVAEVTASRNGTLDSSEPLVITWAASNSDGIASQAMTVDDRAITPISGPFSSQFYSSHIGAWSPGTHTYAITSTDASGISATTSGTFLVAAAAAAPVTIGSIVVAENSTARDGTLDSSEMLVITWAASSSDSITSQAVTIDGRSVAPVYGPYSRLYYSSTIGAWSAGTHTFVITTTNSAGFTANSSGTFTVAAAAAALRANLLDSVMQEMGNPLGS